MLGAWQEFTSGWDSVKVCHLREVEINGKVLIAILKRQNVIFSISSSAFAELDGLSALLDLMKDSSSHHLDLKIFMAFAKVNESKGCIVFWLYLVLLFKRGAGWLIELDSLGMIRKTFYLLVLFGSADELYW